MRKRYIFFDYDGTLRSRQTDSVPESTKRAIDELREAGHFVGLATGRLQSNAMRLVAESGIDSMVADGGNSLTIDGKLLWMAGMPLQPCRNLLHWLDGAGIPWAVMTENRLVRYTPSATFSEWLPDTYIKTIIDPEMDIDRIDPIYKFFIPVGRDMEGRIPFNGVTWARYSPEVIYCEPTDKSVGIRKMMAHYEAPLSDVVVFGDGTNDLAMFRPEWTSVAMGNACESLKQRATFVTDDVNHDGIWNACVKLGLFEE